MRVDVIDLDLVGRLFDGVPTWVHAVIVLEKRSDIPTVRYPKGRPMRW